MRQIGAVSLAKESQMKHHRLIGYAEELRKSGEDGTTSIWHLVDRGWDGSMYLSTANDDVFG
jgi:hypothetical protein